MRHKLSWKCKRWTHNFALIIEIQKKKKNYGCFVNGASVSFSIDWSIRRFVANLVEGTYGEGR